MATTCPGPYLQSKFPYIASEVNKRLGGQPTPTPSGNNTIKYIQGTLNIRYGYKLDVDGLVGRDTWKHLRMALQHELNVQFNAGLVEDGILGVKSQQALSRVIVRKGAQGNITWLIQACLNIKGYSTNGIDGIFGSGTSNAIYRFQQNNGLAKDSIVGKNTFEKLFR
jgi:peptidoglycan hydrolase-like protein with peptidoglycan-binding domain